MGVTPGTFCSFTTEALTAVRHANGVDFWVIVKPIIVPAGSPTFIGAFNPTPTAPAGATNSSLYAYLVSASGVSSTPVISNANAPADFGPGPLNVTNEIKCSPDGQYATWTNRTAANAGNTNLYRFNSGTGQFLFLSTLLLMAHRSVPIHVCFMWVVTGRLARPQPELYYVSTISTVLIVIHTLHRPSAIILVLHHLQRDLHRCN
jgi:hypothetical protein